VGDPAAATGHRALVIEADEAARRETRLALEARGIAALTAPCGLSGLDALLEHLLDLSIVVADLRAPGLDGWRLVRIVRQLGNEQDLRLLITGEGVPGAWAARLAEMGADAVLDRSVGPAGVAEHAAALLALGPRAGSPARRSIVPAA
jgi:CheY-like chemotaxis protein